MYSNDFTQIRQGLTNYVGAIIKSLNAPTIRASKQTTISMLIDEALKIGITDDNDYDLYALKGIFNSVIIILNKRVQKLKESYHEYKRDEIKEQIDDYEQIISFFNNMITNIQ